MLDLDEQQMDAGVRVIDLEQNTPEWHAERAGIPTASAADLLLPTGRMDQPSKTRRTYMYRLMGERLTGQPSEQVQSKVLERGHVMEPEAAQDYALVSGNEIGTIGFMRRGDVGYSPDRIIVGQPGSVEIKSKKPERQLAVLLADAMPDEHTPQVQCGLLVSGFAYCDFVSYWPGLPLFVKRIYRDEKYIAFLREEIDQFNAELAELETQIVAKHYGGVHPQTGETV